MSFNIIGIRGNRIGCGKDTVTNLIIKELEAMNILVEHKKFATPIRKIVAELLNVPFEFTETTEGKGMYVTKANKTIGKLLQDIGSSLKDVIHDEIWIDSCFYNYNDKKVIIFSDVRFPKEMEAILKRGGCIIEVVRDGNPSETALAGRSLSHESETSLHNTKSNYTINNNGTIEELECIVKTLINKIYKV